MKKEFEINVNGFIEKISIDENEFVGQMSKKICPVQLDNTNRFTRKSRVVKGYKTVVEYTLQVSV